MADGHAVNHQWSKGEEFERGFGELVRATLWAPASPCSPTSGPRSELWVAQRFARLTGYHRAFRSCNRAFHQDPAQRLDHWCGRCDKCCFVDLVLAPFMDRADLDAVFGGRRAPREPRQRGSASAPCSGWAPTAKPFECVGDVDECRAALRCWPREREDRAGTVVLRRLRRRAGRRPAGGAADAAALLEPRGTHRIPDRYAPADLLVRAR